VRTEIRFAGAGGQGLVTAALVLAQAATDCGFHVVQSQAHGPAARGGASSADVVLSDEPILYPKAKRLDFLIALTAEGAKNFADDLKEGGLLLADEDRVTEAAVPSSVTRTLRAPLSRTLREVFGHEGFISAAALGFLIGATMMLPPERMEEALSAKFPSGVVDENRRAFRLGLDFGVAAKDRPALLSPFGAAGEEADADL
jgi:2-oxoglutarate ferredoxin oxidoreductase subunit gamma